MATQPSMYTLFIQLEPLQIEPPVWRRIRVTSDCTLRMRIPANVTGHSGDRDRFAHGLHAGTGFVL